MDTDTIAHTKDERYVSSAVQALDNVVLIIAIPSVFGVETTTFAGLLAAPGGAIGMAWPGLR